MRPLVCFYRPMLVVFNDWGKISSSDPPVTCPLVKINSSWRGDQQFLKLNLKDKGYCFSTCWCPCPCLCIFDGPGASDSYARPWFSSILSFFTSHRLTSKVSGSISTDAVMILRCSSRHFENMKVCVTIYYQLNVSIMQCMSQHTTHLLLEVGNSSGAACKFTEARRECNIQHDALSTPKCGSGRLTLNRQYRGGKGTQSRVGRGLLWTIFGHLLSL